MKVVLSNKAYFNTVDKELWELCLSQTFYQIYPHGSQYPQVFQNSGAIGERMKFIPITRLDTLTKKGLYLEIIDKRINTPTEIPKPKFELRPDQQEIYEQVDDTCIINGKPGFGKTILALAIAHKFQVKTLVVCTNVMIRDQWRKEVVKHFGFEPGIIGSGQFNIAPPIVIGNIQTLNKHAQQLGKEFGLVIVDEMHHCVATTFTKFLEQSSARYKIGLSGTLKRKDGLNVMFKDFFGLTVFSPAVSNTIKPVIHRYEVDIEVSGNNNVPWATRANDVYENQEYRHHLIDKLFLYYRMGHKVLFVSDRTELIHYVIGILDDADVYTETIIGPTSLEDREKVLQSVKNHDGPLVLAAAQTIFSEGVSRDELSCLVIGSLINNESLIEQLAGRIMRITPDKMEPVLVDTVLKGGTGWNQAKGRSDTYRDNGWDTIFMTPEREANLKKIVFAED